MVAFRKYITHNIGHFKNIQEKFQDAIDSLQRVNNISLVKG